MPPPWRTREYFKAMPFSTASVFGEHDSFQAALIKECHLKQFVTAGARFRARLTEVKLDRLRFLAVEQHLPCIGFLAVPPTKVLLSFPIDDRAAQTWGGTTPRKGELITFGPGYRGHMRTLGPCRWGAIWFPVEELADYIGDVTERSLLTPPVGQLWRPRSVSHKCLLQLYGAAIRAANVRHEAIVSADGITRNGAGVDRSCGRMPFGRAGISGNTECTPRSRTHGHV